MLPCHPRVTIFSLVNIGIGSHHDFLDFPGDAIVPTKQQQLKRYQRDERSTRNHIQTQSTLQSVENFVAAIPQLRIHFKVELAQLIWKDETAGVILRGRERREAHGLKTNDNPQQVAVAKPR
jgi:hypothetical protein